MHRSKAVTRALAVAALLLSVAGTTVLAESASAAIPTWVRKPCAPTAIPSPLRAGTYCRNVVVDGYKREYWLYVPTKVANKPATSVPIVVMHHGSSGNGQQFLNISGWREKADAEGFIAAFPTGLQYFVTDGGTSRWNTKWNDVKLIENIDVNRRLPGYPATAPWPANDILFENKLLDDAGSVVKVDPKRIFVSGFSNGSGFALRVSIEMSTRVAAVGSSAGGMLVHPSDVPVGTVPSDNWLVVGSLDDGMLAIAGVSELPMDPAALLTNGFTRGTMYTHARAWGLPTVACSVNQTATTTTFNYCAPGKPEFHFTVVKGMTHVYPHGYAAASNPSGFKATTVFWPFFVAHPLP